MTKSMTWWTAVIRSNVSEVHEKVALLFLTFLEYFLLLRFIYRTYNYYLKLTI